MLHHYEISRHSHHAIPAMRSAPSPCETCPVRKASICGYDGLDLSRFGDMTKRLTKPAKSTIVDQGNQADAVFTAVSGAVLLSKSLPDGRRQVVGIALPGDFIGLSMAEVHGFSATALTQVEYCRIDRARFSEMLDEEPRLVRRLYATSASELTFAQEHMILLGRRSADEKLATFLLNMRERWARIRSASARVDLPLTRQDIGDYLGLTIETVSRTFSKLAKQKLIAIIPDGIRILDLAGLAALGSG